jgi:uncharacterized protein with PIN domain
MNRKQRRTAEKVMGKETAQRANLMLSTPEKCLTCEAKFDKKSKEMAMTWFVEVFNEQKRVDLYCPECQEKRTK